MTQPWHNKDTTLIQQRHNDTTIASHNNDTTMAQRSQTNYTTVTQHDKRVSRCCVMVSSVLCIVGSYIFTAAFLLRHCCGIVVTVPTLLPKNSERRRGVDFFAEKKAAPVVSYVVSLLLRCAFFPHSLLAASHCCLIIRFSPMSHFVTLRCMIAACIIAGHCWPLFVVVGCCVTVVHCRVIVRSLLSDRCGTVRSCCVIVATVSSRRCCLMGR